MTDAEVFAAGFQKLLDGADHSRLRIPTVRGNGWLAYGPMKVYIRINPRYVDRTASLMVTIANVDAPEEHQRKGLFTQMVREIRRNTPLPIYLENTQREFADALIRRGWRMVRTDGRTKDLIKDL